MASTFWLRPFRRLSLPTLALAAAMALAACGAPSQAASSTSAQSSESAVGLPNPIVECATLAELNAATGKLPMAAPADATKVRYAYIKNGSEAPIAQIDFTVDGMPCTLRGATMPIENLAGVYETATEEEKTYNETHYVTAAGQAVAVSIKAYPSGLVAEWQWGETTYSLYQQGDSRAIIGNGWYYAVNSCVQLVADTPQKDDWKACLRADYESWEQLDRYSEVQVGEIQAVPAAEQKSVAVGTDEIDLASYPITCKEKQTWQSYLENVPGSLLAQTTLSYQYVNDGGETVQTSVIRYDLLCQGENGSYYKVDTLPV